MMNKSNQKKEGGLNKLPIIIALAGILFAGAVVVLDKYSIEYIEFDKSIDFAGKTFYVYKYIQETPIHTKHTIVKYVCPEKITNTTCLVTDRALICENFSCLIYKGMIKSS